MIPVTLRDIAFATKRAVDFFGCHFCDSYHEYVLASRRPSPFAVTAFEWLCSSVLPEVSGELIASCKAPLAAFP